MVGGPCMSMSDERFVRRLDERYGLRNLKLDWVSAQRTSQQSALVRSICNSQICEISDGSLPWSIRDAHRVQLGTKVLVQIDEVINLGAPDSRSPSTRLLQHTLTDGATSFTGIELDTTTSGLSPNTVPGTKITLLPTALLIRGRVLLTCEDYELVGAPQGQARVAVNGQVMQILPRHIGTRQSAGSLGGASRDPCMNPTALSITNVGGIAAFTEENDDGGEADRLWSMNLFKRSRDPALSRQKMPGTSPVLGIVAEERFAPTGRSLSGAGRPPCSNDPKASGTNARNIARRRGSVLDSVRGYSVTENGATLVGVSPFTSCCTVGGVPMDINMDSTTTQPNQETSKIPNSPEVMQVSHSNQRQLHQESPQMGAVNGISMHVARLKDMTYSPHNVASKERICRLYAVKMGKQTGYHMTRVPVVSALVDDGTAIRIVSVSDKLLDHLRMRYSSGTGTLSQGAHIRNPRFLRSIHGFVKLEFRGNTLVATACVPESVASTVLPGFLSDVNARFSRFLSSIDNRPNVAS